MTAQVPGLYTPIMTITTEPLTGDHKIGEVTITLPIDVDMITSTLCTAVEGGVGYWSYAEQIERETVPESIDSVGWRYESYVLDIGTHNIGEGVEFDPEQVAGVMLSRHTARVTYDTIVTGIQRIVTGQVPIADYILEYVMSALRENDPGHIDATAADCIVQAGLFGKLVYG